MQWAWQNDSIRADCDNLPSVHSVTKTISESEDKLQVVMARGLLNQDINFSFVNTLVRGKNPLLLLLNFDHLPATSPDLSYSCASPCKRTRYATL